MIILTECHFHTSLKRIEIYLFTYTIIWRVKYKMIRSVESAQMYW